MSGQVGRWELEGVTGAVVVIDVLRAFTTAAYAFGAGATTIYVVEEVADALAFKADNPGVLALGEDGGFRADGFDLANSPTAARDADLAGRTLVQRTSAGTKGVMAATSATRLWVAGLVCASATARAVAESDLGDPTYVITGRVADRPDDSGEDDELTAACIERARTRQPLEAAATAEALRQTRQAQKVLGLGPPHSEPDDIELAATVDRFDFAIEVIRDERGLRLIPTTS